MESALFCLGRTHPARLLRLLIAISFITAISNSISEEPAGEIPEVTGDSIPAAADSTAYDFGFEDWRGDFGADFNSDIQSYYASLTLPLWSRKGSLLFLESQFTWHDPLEEQANVGLAWRQWCERFAAIVGANVFYDWSQSRHGNGFDGIGLGFEVLRDDFEFHFNYYLPQSRQPVIGTMRETDRTSHVMSTGGSVSSTGATERTRKVNTTESRSRTSATFRDGQGNTVSETTTRSTTRKTVSVMSEREFVQRFGATKEFERIDIRDFRLLEAAMEGYDIEAGIPIACLPDQFDFWLFAGYYDFNNPFGGDLNGFQGRLEWRVNPNLALEATYFSQERLVVGENWYVGLRGSIPLEGKGNLFARLLTPQEKPGIAGRWLQRIRRDRRHHMTESDYQLAGTDTHITRRMTGGGSRFFSTKSSRSSKSSRTTSKTTTDVTAPPAPPPPPPEEPEDKEIPQ